MTSLVTYVAQGLAYVALPFYFQEALGRTPLESGLLLTSWPLSIAVMAPLAGRLSDRVSVGVLATAGLSVLTVGLALYATLPPNPTGLDIVLRGIVCGLGFGFFQSPNNREIMGSAPREKSASAAGLLASARVGGQTLGAALVAIVFGLFGAEVVDGAAAPTRPSPRPPRPRSGWPALRRRRDVASALRLRPRAPSAQARARADPGRSPARPTASGYAATSAVRNFAASPTSTMVGGTASDAVAKRATAARPPR